MDNPATPGSVGAPSPSPAPTSPSAAPSAGADPTPSSSSSGAPATSAPSAPSAQPTAPSSGQPTPEQLGGRLTAKEQFDFSGFAADFGFGAPLEESPGGAPTGQPTVAAPQESTPPVAQPTPSPQVAQPPTMQPQALQGYMPPQTVEQLVGALHGNEEQLVQSLLPEFALDQETITALETDAAQEVPRLLAKTYTKAVTESMRLVQHFVPAMVQQGISRAVFGMQADATFFNMNKDLNREQHAATIRAIGPSLRAQYPQLGITEFMRMLGNVVRSAHGLPPQTQQPTGMPPGAPRAMPFVPAQSNGGRVVTPPTPVAGPFDGLGMEFDN